LSEKRTKWGGAHNLQLHGTNEFLGEVAGMIAFEDPVLGQRFQHGDRYCGAGGPTGGSGRSLAYHRDGRMGRETMGKMQARLKPVSIGKTNSRVEIVKVSKPSQTSLEKNEERLGR